MKTTENEPTATTRPPTFHFPVGYYQLHEDPFLNFEMNRPFNRVGDESMLAEMRVIAPRIQTVADGAREFLVLAQTAFSHGETLKAAYYYRTAEFFMPDTDPQKRPARQRFVQLARTCYGIEAAQQLAIPYRDGSLSGTLPGYRFSPARPKDTLVIFGGFDSFMEEYIPMAFFFRDAGFDVVLFEGPGQGGALEDAGLPLTHEWEKPTAAVLDHLGLDNVSLMGRSLGGYLVLRAAAFEPRVRRVIADDIIFDFYACILHHVGADDRARFTAALELKSAAAMAAINAVVERGAQRSPLVAWNIQQGMHVMGVSTPFEYFERLRRYSAAEISARVEQDVLLLAASRDHFVPLEMFYR